MRSMKGAIGSGLQQLVPPANTSGTRPGLSAERRGMPDMSSMSSTVQYAISFTRDFIGWKIDNIELSFASESGISFSRIFSAMSHQGANTRSHQMSGSAFMQP